MIAKQIRVNGLVQGVCFRMSTKEKADELGVTGTVRNCKRRKDSVKIFAEGKPEDLDQFVQWCHEGPEGAEVTEVEITEAAAKNSKSFEITD